MTGPSRSTLDAVWNRARSSCERCGVGLLRDAGGYSIHHRRLKGQGGDRRPDTHMPANLALLCGSGVTACHGWAHHRRLEARDLGFVVSRWADPAEWGMLSALAGWVLLDNAGGTEPWEARIVSGA